MLHYKNRSAAIFLDTIIACIILVSPVFSANDSLIPFRLDGFNTILFNQEYPHQSYNMYSIIYGNPLDRFPFSLLSDFKPIDSDNSNSQLRNDSLFHQEVTWKLGSETGEMLFNAFEGIAQENRDHFTTFATACAFPRSPLDFYFGYRYLDHYSDRFDNLWKKFEDKMDQRMAFSSQGLAYEFSGGYSLSGPVATTTLKTVSYKRWGATPYYFSPLFTSGYLLSPTLIFTLPKSKLLIDFVFDYHKDFYDHIHYTEYTDEEWNITWQKKLQKGITAELSHHRNSRLTSSTYANATFYDTIPNLLIWTLSGNVYGNLRLGGSVDVKYIQIPKFAVNLNTGWKYVPKTREYTFWDIDVPVEYHSKSYEVATLHTSIQYTDKLFFPIQASIWLDYCEKPLWETIEWPSSNKTIIRQDTINNAARLTYGGKGSYNIALFNNFYTTLWGNMSITPKNKHIRFSLPLNLGADIAWGKPDNDSLYAMVSVEHRDRTSLKYMEFTSGDIIEYKSPAQTSLSLILKMPFHLPFLRKYIRTNFQIEAGPIRFVKEQRVAEHPLGNPIGPAISLGFNGFFN